MNKRTMTEKKHTTIASTVGSHNGLEGFHPMARAVQGVEPLKASMQKPEQMGVKRWQKRKMKSSS